MLDKIDFVDIVAVGFGVILLFAIIMAYFKGMPIDQDLRAWFFAVLTFFIGKKTPITFGK